MASIGSRKVTDALLVGMSTQPYGVNVHPADVGVRAAWVSAAYLLREAAWRALDAAPDELTAGFRPTLGSISLTGEIYLSDSILNGAGYARYFATHDGLSQLLASLATVEERLLNHASADAPCDSSCYRCLRDHSNSRLHLLLDWRLAMDLSEILRLGTIDPTRFGDHTIDHAEKFAAAVPGCTVDELGGRKIIVKAAEGLAWIIHHPLETVHIPSMGAPLAAAWARAESTYHTVEPLSWFDLSRRPGLVAQRIAGIT